MTTLVWSNTYGGGVMLCLVIITVWLFYNIREGGRSIPPSYIGVRCIYTFESVLQNIIPDTDHAVWSAPPNVLWYEMKALESSCPYPVLLTHMYRMIWSAVTQVCSLDSRSTEQIQHNFSHTRVHGYGTSCGHIILHLQVHIFKKRFSQCLSSTKIWFQQPGLKVHKTYSFIPRLAGSGQRFRQHSQKKDIRLLYMCVKKVFDFRIRPWCETKVHRLHRPHR